MYASVPMIGLTPWARALLEELEDPVHVAVVGDPERRLAVGYRLGDELVEARRAVEHRELGVDVEMGERIPQCALPPFPALPAANLHGCYSLDPTRDAGSSADLRRL